MHHRKRELAFLLALLVVFFILFVIGILHLQRNTPVFGLKIDIMAENLLIIILSLLAILKILWLLIKH